MKKIFRKAASVLLAAAVITSTAVAALPASAATTVPAMDANPRAYSMYGVKADTGFSAGTCQEDGSFLVTSEKEVYLIDDGYLTTENLVNYTIDLDMKIVNGAAGFIFAAKDTSYFLMWQLNDGTGHCVFRPHHWNPGGASLGDVDISNVVPDEKKNDWHHMKIVVTDSKHIVTYVDDALIDERDHDLASFGKIGFRHNGAETGAFDNIVITDGDGKEVYRQEFNAPAPNDGSLCTSEGDTFEHAGGKTVSFFAAADSHKTGKIVFDIPEGATSFTGTVGQCDQALDGEFNNMDDIAYFAVDGEYQSIVGPLRTYRQEQSYEHCFYDFDIAIPEGAKSLTLYVREENYAHKDHIIFFDTVFNIGDGSSQRDAAVDAVDKEIASLLFNTKYNYRAALLSVYDSYSKLTEDQKAATSGGYWLECEKAKSDAALAADPTFEATRDNVSDNGFRNAWIKTCSDDVWNATKAAIADEIKFQQAVNNRHITGQTGSDFDSWMSGAFWYIGLVGGADNLNHQPYRDNWTTIVPSFPGMAFSTDTFMAQNWVFASIMPIGEFFEYDGKVYQVSWDLTFFHDIATPSNSANLVSVQNYGWHPEERASDSDTNKNIFRYAYAKYSQDHKWEGLTLGLAPSDWATATGNTRHQYFEGPQGAAYLITTVDMVAAAPTDMTSATYADDMAKAYVAVTGKTASNIADDSEFFAKAGEFLKEENGALYFENAKVTEDGVFYAADYSAVEAAKAKIPADTSIYTEESVKAVTDAVAAVVTGKFADEQDVVNGYAEAIETAISNLKLKLDMSISISDGVATEAETEGRMNITWNANVIIGDTETLDSINGKVTFKSYGVYYGTSEAAVKEIAAGTETNLAKKLAFAEGDDIDVYTIFGLRLKNVAEGRTRAAMFYITFEYEGSDYTIYSDCVEAVAE